jgi:Arc/MetJ-type ribon-helix-helix transcriptional regulator
MSTKERLSVTVDADLIRAGHRIVEAGRAESLSAWVNTALRAELQRDEKLRAMDTAIAEYEAANGIITEADIVAAERSMQARTIHVRPGRGDDPAA